MLLTKNGVPYEEAFRMGQAKRTALAIVCNELDGAVFDWSTQRYVEPKS